MISPRQKLCRVLFFSPVMRVWQIIWVTRPRTQIKSKCRRAMSLSYLVRSLDLCRLISSCTGGTLRECDEVQTGSARLAGIEGIGTGTRDAAHDAFRDPPSPPAPYSGGVRRPASSPGRALGR